MSNIDIHKKKMSQPSVTAYFSTRKRQATEDLRNKAKVLLLEQEQTRTISSESLESSKADKQEDSMGISPKIMHVMSKSNADGSAMKSNSAVKNIQFDSPKAGIQKAAKTTRSRTTQQHKSNTNLDGQPDIRESFSKMSSNVEAARVPFEKKGMLSPRKKQPSTPKKIVNTLEEKKASLDHKNEQLAAGCVTPKKAFNREQSIKNLDLNEIKNRINKSNRLAELKASIDRIKKCDQRLTELQKQNEIKKPQINKFEKIHLEIPVSPQKTFKSPTKTIMSPMKNESLNHTSPQRRILFEPKETTSPVKSKPDKAPAYQRYLSLTDSGTSTLPLPYSYRFLAEAFRCIDTVSAMLFNRKEIITFKKLKPAVQELLRRNFTLDHLAQIKTIYPDAYFFNQEKLRSYGSISKQDKYELVLTPNVQVKNESIVINEDDVLKAASDVSMNPGVLLERRRKFYNILLERVKDEHEKFLLSLEAPMVIPKEKIMRWHPEFDVENCKPIERSDLPQPPDTEKATSAKHVLEKAKSLFNCNTRMEKALQRLAEANMTSKSIFSEASITDTKEAIDNDISKVNIAVVDTPPATPTMDKSYLSTAFKGIPKALLEKVRAKQAAKALEMMTRTPDLDKEATLYSRLPELAKILRSIFVAEKKGVLPLEHVLTKLDNSFRTKLTAAELEEHVRKLCKLLPTWISIHNVRKVDYLKLIKDVDMAKVIKMLEIMANDKVTAAS